MMLKASHTFTFNCAMWALGELQNKKFKDQDKATESYIKELEILLGAI